MKETNKQKQYHRQQVLQLGFSMPMSPHSKNKEDRRSILVAHHVNLQITPFQQQSEGIVAHRQAGNNLFNSNIKKTNMKIRFNLADEKLRQDKQVQIRMLKPFKDITQNHKKADQKIQVVRIHKLILPPVSKISSMPKPAKVDPKIEITPQKLLKEKNLSQTKSNKNVVGNNGSIVSKFEDITHPQLKKNTHHPNNHGQGIQKKNPSKEELAIIQLMSYRLQAQNYSFTDIEQIMRKQGEPAVIQQYVRCVLEKEPFFMSPDQAQTLMKYVMQSYEIQNLSQVSEALRDMLKQQETISMETKTQALFQLAVVVSSNNYLSERMRREGNTITKQKLSEILGEIQISGKEVQVIIGQLCMCSPSLQELHYAPLLDSLW